MGLDETDSNRQNLEVYREAFEKPFLLATETYYKAESEQFIGDNSVTEYMKKAENRLGEEEDRVDLYLHASTRKGLVSKCEEVLVKGHEGLMQEEFQRVRSSLSLIACFHEEKLIRKRDDAYSSSIRNKKPTCKGCTYSSLEFHQDSIPSENVSNNTSRKPVWNRSNAQSDPLLPLRRKVETKKQEVLVKA